MSTSGRERYEELRREHRWEVPAGYNIAADVCDRHPRDALAMVHEHCDGAVREVHWGELQDLANQAANVLAGARRGARGPRGGRAAADGGDGGRVLRDLEARRDPAVDVGALRRRGHPPPAHRCRAEGARHRRRQRCPLRRRSGRRTCWSSTSTRFAGVSSELRDRCDTPPMIRRSSTTPRARPAWQRGSSTPTATCWRTRSSTTATTCSAGERFHGMGEWAWAAGICPLLGPWRLGAVQCVYQREARFRPAPPARLPLPPRGRERLRHADGDPLDDVDRRRARRATRSAFASSARRASR